MKYIVIMSLILCNTCFSQSISKGPVHDTLRTVMYNMREAGFLMQQQNRQWRNGMYLSIFSYAGSAFCLASPSFEGTADKSSNYYAAAGFGILNLIGVIIMLDSHKYTKRASEYLINSGGQIGLGLKF